MDGAFKCVAVFRSEGDSQATGQKSRSNFKLSTPIKFWGWMGKMFECQFQLKLGPNLYYTFVGVWPVVWEIREPVK